MAEFICEPWVNSANQTVHRCVEVVEQSDGSFPWWVWWFVLPFLVVFFLGAMLRDY
jgi:hypothetical protein